MDGKSEVVEIDGLGKCAFYQLPDGRWLCYRLGVVTPYGFLRDTRGAAVLAVQAAFGEWPEMEGASDFAMSEEEKRSDEREYGE